MFNMNISIDNEIEEDNLTKETGIHSNESGTIKNYFQFYSKISNQQNMLQDYVRTSCYFNAIQNNIEDFLNKRVMDLGTGSGILAIFAAAAGAEKVFAIEASDAIYFAEKLIKSHNFDKKIEIINSKVEDIPIKDELKVDTLISEPLGILLVNERMLESYITAREKFLKKGGKMYPSHSIIYFMPFSDESLYNEQLNKVSFWDNKNFFGLNMNCLKEEALKEKLRQPVIDVYDPLIHICDRPCSKFFDFYKIKADDLLEFEVDLEFKINKPTLMHGVSCWFDAHFRGTNQEITLTTSPYNTPTHWYQVRLLLQEPLAINKGNKIKGKISFQANKFQSYYIYLKIGIPEYNIWTENNYDLKDPEFRGFTNYTYNPKK